MDAFDRRAKRILSSKFHYSEIQEKRNHLLRGGNSDAFNVSLELKSEDI